MSVAAPQSPRNPATPPTPSLPPPPAAIRLTDAAAWAGGALRLPPGTRDAGALAIAGASLDTRSIAPGALFVPLGGSRADGHTFLEEAFANGAAAALCERGRADALAGREPGPLIAVADVTTALQRIAARQRERWSGLMLGITGSAGKTTTKDLVALALGADRPTLRTEGNLNNHWGVPLTLLRLSDEHRAAVVEMGMSQPGEIAALARVAAPDAAVITLVGSAHLEAFGTIEAIAAEKTSLARALPAGAPVFAGADSAPLMHALAGVPQRVVRYGLAPDADVRPRRLEPMGEEGFRLEVEGFPPAAIALVGRHQVSNALAAFAVAREYRLDPESVVRALESYRPGRGRMEIRHAGGATLLVDCYNSSPEAARAALETLATWPGATRRIALLGDMLELGERAARLHVETGAAVRDAELWTLGDHAADYAAGARTHGVASRVFANAAEAGRALREALAPGLVVLLKASRGVALERALDEIGGA